ncbi:transketolase [Luteitalea sp. TBR-22]|nr:transketolase [Luteitalea sp. TBR-22]BCS35305.1 transketolase [Luteitalea sp. TBR-22]
MSPSVAPAHASLHNIATRLRIDSVRSTTKAGSGHPSTCASAAEIAAVLFCGEMRYDPKDPHRVDNDRFILSKGHAAPLLYAAWAEVGIVSREATLTLRELTSDLEGHPTPRLPWVDLATGSLGQGLAAGVGCALNARRIGSDYRTYVLMGDGEMAEGSVWEAAQSGQFHQLDSLCAIVDLNGLGQSRATQFGHDTETVAARWRAFGWHAIVLDGHDIGALQAAFAEARATSGKPTVLVARTEKGKGIALMEGKAGWHGKPMSAEQAEAAVAELEAQLVPEGGAGRPEIPMPSGVVTRPDPAAPAVVEAPSYTKGDLVATREAYGTGLAKLGVADARVVALDADVKNSTFTDRFEKVAPERFYQSFIAEQVMAGMAMGLAARGAIPFATTFAAFLTRAADFIRMAGISGVNTKFAGSHCGVSIGEDGGSQMALEDLAMFRAVPGCAVLYPCDAVSAEKLVATAAAHPGMAYIRTSRPKTPVIYDAAESFPVGGSKVLRSSASDAITIVTAGVTVFEALKAADAVAADGIHVRVIDLYSVKPVDAATITAAGRETGLLVTVEDHYAAGGIGDAVCEVASPLGLRVERVAVPGLPRSGTPEELMDVNGLSAAKLAATIRRLVSAR